MCHAKGAKLQAPVVWILTPPSHHITAHIHMRCVSVSLSQNNCFYRSHTMHSLK